MVQMVEVWVVDEVVVAQIVDVTVWEVVVVVQIVLVCVVEVVVVMYTSSSVVDVDTELYVTGADEV